MRKLDRRVRRTRTRLHSALHELILKQGYDSITIQEITDLADVSRATFYLHFHDKNELLASSLESIFEELEKSIRGAIFRTALDINNSEPPSLQAFLHVIEYQDLYRALLGLNGVTSVIYQTLDFIARVAQQQLEVIIKEYEIVDPPVPLNIAARHIAGALFAVVSWWLENDTPRAPEEMAQLYHTMIIPAVRQGLGLVQVVEEK